MASSSSTAATTTLNEANLEKRLLNVTNTQESIQTLSLWCLHHKAHHAKIVQIWTKVFKTAKMNHRLALFYLANDVIQNSKRKGFLHFGEAWMPSIKETIPMVTEDRIKAQMDRILTIWEERSVYDAQFINELRAMFVNVNPDEPSDIKLLADFKPQRLVEKMKKFKKLEADIELKHKQFASLKLDVCSTETLKQLKDKAHGTKFTKDFEDATMKLDEFVQILQRRVKERKALIEILEESCVFYDTQRKEAKIVANAYKNFGSRVKNLQGKLDEMLPELSSPVPSPPFDAPSPEDSSLEGSAATVGSKDNTEAVDMEMSDDELGVNTAVQDKDEVSSLSSAPSPDGSPVGLSTSPTPSFVPVISKSLTPHSKATATSLLESLRKSTAATASANAAASISTPKTTASSLDIRLSNLMHNIPNFATSLFGGHPLVDTIKVPQSAATVPQEGCATPLKDEESCAGSATPLQDENREMKLNAKTPSDVKTSNIIDSLIHKLSSASAPNNLLSNQHLAIDIMKSKQKYGVQDDAMVDTVMPPSFCNFSPPAMVGQTKTSMDSHAPTKKANGDEPDKAVGLLLPTGESPFRRNSNIVQLTPSPSVSPKFDISKLEQQQHCWIVENQAMTMGKDNASCPTTVLSPDLTLPMRPLGDGVFFPSKLNPPKKSTITINLRNTKTQGTPVAVKKEFLELALPAAAAVAVVAPAQLNTPNTSNLRTIVPLTGENNNESLEDMSEPPIYSKIETLESSRDDFWAPTPSWNPIAQQHVVNRPQMDYQRQPRQLLPPQQRHPRPYDGGRGFPPSWQGGVGNPHWRNPAGPIPKRPLLMPNVPPARWNYYHPQY